MGDARSRPIPWLFGPWPDLLLGCGLLYALGFGVFLLVGPEIRSAQPHLLFPLLILALGVPHYGATLLRVYERRRERREPAACLVNACTALAHMLDSGRCAGVPPGRELARIHRP